MAKDRVVNNLKLQECCIKHYAILQVFTGNNYNNHDIFECTKFLSKNFYSDNKGLVKKVTVHCHNYHVNQIDYDNPYLKQFGTSNILQLYESEGIEKINEVLNMSLIGTIKDNINI